MTQHHAVDPRTASNDELLNLVHPWEGVVPRGYFATFSGSLVAAPFWATWSTREQLEEVLSSDRYIKVPRPKEGTDGYFEQANIIRSIMACDTDTYTMLELGGGTGARAVDCALQLKKLRPDTHPLLVVVEGVPTYLSWCRSHFRANGIAPEDHWFLPGIVGTDARPALFFLHPQGFGNSALDADIMETLEELLTDRQSGLDVVHRLAAGGVTIQGGKATHKDASYAPLELSSASEWTVDKIMTPSEPKHCEIGFVNSYTLENILAPLDHVDFIDMDIQHAEARVLPSAINAIRSKVRLLSVGTHSHTIHADLRKLFLEIGWPILNDREPFSAEFWSDGVLTVWNPCR